MMNVVGEDVQTKNDYIIENNEQLCIIDCKLNLENIVKIYKYVNNKEENFDLNIRFRKNISEQWRATLLYNFYYNDNFNIIEESDSIKNRYYNKPKNPFNVITQLDYLESIFYIFEFKIDNDFDETIIQYLLCVLEFFNNKGIKSASMISASLNEGKKSFLPIEFDNRLRTFISLYYTERKIITDNIYIFKHYKKNDKSEYRWTKIISSKVKYIGRILPSFPINKKTIRILNNKFINNQTDKDYYNLYNCYKEKIIGLADEQLNEYKESDSVLDSIIFISTLYYMYFNEKETAIPSSEEINLLHEICCDYSQGIAQLIENAYFHAVGNKSEQGSANFTIRIRKVEDAKSLYITEKSYHSDFLMNVKFFMELFVTDLQFEDFKDLREKFLLNISERLKNNQYENSNTSLENLRKEITLASLFTGEGKALKQYLKEPLNVAFHYGLQILNNVISVANGFLYVRSGSGNENEYELENDNYSKTSLKWENGTAYIIYLPIKLVRVDFQDTVALIGEEFLDDCKYVEIKISPIDKYPAEMFYEIDNKTKENLTEQIRTELFNFVDKTTRNFSVTQVADINNYIFYLNCFDIPLYAFEVLAKAIFLCFANTGFVLKNIALINIDNREEVIKLFRQFSLFYNREGESYVTNNRTVFFVDKNAELDILLDGNINSIVKNMYHSQINGGLDSRAIEIIKHLGGRR